MKTYPNARSALLTFYITAGAKLPVKSFDELVQHYRTHRYSDGEILMHDDFLEEFDGAVKVPQKIDTTTAMKKLASATPQGKLPNTQAFFKALADQAGSLTAREFTGAVVEGLKDTAKTAAGLATAGLGIYILIGVGVILLPQIAPILANKIKAKL